MNGLNLEGRIIGVDFDGCIGSGARMKVRLAMEMFGLRITVEQTAEDVFSNIYGKEKYRKLMDVCGKRTSEYELLPNCREVLLLLKGEGATPVVITSREDDEVAAARAFNSTQEVPINDIYHTKRQSKREVILRLKPSVYLDDSFWKLMGLLGTGTLLCFFKQDWNRHEHEAAAKMEDANALMSVNGWARFYSRFTGKEFPSGVVKYGVQSYKAHHASRLSTFWKKHCC